MEYQRSGTEQRANLEYILTYNIPKQANNRIEATLQIFPIDADRPYKYDINLPSGGRYDEIEEGFKLELDFNQIEEGWIEIKNTAGDNPRFSRKLEVPPPKIFNICRTIIEGYGFFGEEDWLKKYYSPDREGYHLIRFRKQAEKILKFRDYIEILSFLSDQHPRVANVLAENSLGYFTNRVVNGSEPQSVTSLDDLKFKIELYNSQDFLSDVSLNNILRGSLSDIYQMQRNSGFEYIEHILNKILPETREDVKQLSRTVLGIYVACLLEGKQEDQAFYLLSNWLLDDHNSSGPYASLILQYESEFKNEEDIGVPKVGEYLFYVGFNEVKTGSESGTLSLFEVSSQVIDNGTLAHISKFWAQIRLGERSLGSNDQKAQDAFSEAISLVDSIGDVEYDTNEWERKALSGKYRAIVSRYESESDSESAIEYLSQFVDDDLSELDQNSDLVEQVEALRYELISKENIKNGAVDLARDNLEEALELYSRAGLDNARDRVYARQQLLEGYLSEIRVEFEDASEKYRVASEIYGNSLNDQEIANKYSDLADINMSKSYLLEGNTKLARQELQEVSGSSSETIIHRDGLKSVIDVFEDYTDEVISETLEPHSKVKTTQVGSLVSVEYDINTVQFVVYASQYLRQYGIGTEVLDSIIELTLNDALAPRPVHQDIELDESHSSEEGELLLGISMDELWQSKLPTHIHYKIERLKIREVTAASDFSGLTNTLTTTLELLLVVVSEYYSKKAYGSVRDQISPLNNATLGDLITFVRKLPRESLPIVEDLDKAFSEDILPDREISEIRNSGHHGTDIRHSESQYMKVRDKMVDLFKKIAPYCPIIVEVEDKNTFGNYLCVVHWGGIKTRVWLQTNSELENGELYYIPPGDIQNKHLVSVDSDSIYPCESERAQNARQVNPISLAEDN